MTTKGGNELGITNRVYRTGCNELCITNRG